METYFADPNFSLTLQSTQAMASKGGDMAYSHGVYTMTEAIADFKREAQHGQNPDVKAYASKMIPVLEGHLRRAKALAKPVEPRSRARRQSNRVSA
jgi:hypothetical protein